jgi:hypothetical protein
MPASVNVDDRAHWRGRAEEARKCCSKFKNPDAPAVKREAEEDWEREQWR